MELGAGIAQGGREGARGSGRGRAQPSDPATQLTADPQGSDRRRRPAAGGPGRGQQSEPDAHAGREISRAQVAR